MTIKHPIHVTVILFVILFRIFPEAIIVGIDSLLYVQDKQSALLNYWADVSSQVPQQ